MGLRAFKKKQTRKAISHMATKLFIERGYHEVTTAEIAERAEVSVPTLFNYFPNKESLVFDEDDEKEQELVDSVVNRKRGESILDALLHAGMLNVDPLGHDRKLFKNFVSLVEETPELSVYAKQLWLRHEKTLAKTLQKESKNKMKTTEAGAVARFILDAYYRSMGAPDPKKTLRTLFKILKNGWTE